MFSTMHPSVNMHQQQHSQSNTPAQLQPHQHHQTSHMQQQQQQQHPSMMRPSHQQQSSISNQFLSTNQFTSHGRVGGSGTPSPHGGVSPLLSPHTLASNTNTNASSGILTPSESDLWSRPGATNRNMNDSWQQQHQAQQQQQQQQQSLMNDQLRPNSNFNNPSNFNTNLSLPINPQQQSQQHSLSPTLSTHSIQSNSYINSTASTNTTSGASTPYFTSHPNSSPSPSPSPSPAPASTAQTTSIDNNTVRPIVDPARIQALIQVIQQLGDSGVNQKFLSQLGIVFKRIHPTLFQKGLLKELIDAAYNAGFVTLSGPPGQQTVELTSTGQTIARQWRQNHEVQNQQQIASLKEALYAFQQQQNASLAAQAAAVNQQSNQTAASWNLSSQQQSTALTNSSIAAAFNSKGNNPIGFSFLDDSNDPYPSSGSSSLNNTGSSAFSRSNLDTDRTGGFDRDHDINSTGGSFTSHSKDSSKLDLNNIFGSTSSNLFGVTDAEDSELLSSYNEQELQMERFRSKSPTNDLQGNQYHTNTNSSNPSSQYHTGSLSSTNMNSNIFPVGLQNSVRTGPTSQHPVFGPQQVPNHHLAHPAQSQINGSNIHAYLSTGSGLQQQPNNTNNFQQQQQQPQSSPTQSHDPSLPGDPSALQLLPPLPTSLEEKTFRGERLKHLKYIFHFRVHPCLNFLQKGTCPFDNKNECFDYHSLKTRRRIPRIYQFSNGIFWSYNACRCQAIEKEMRCEKGEGCRYAHCKEEIAYHPSRYKSATCSYPLRADGSCSRFGLHCAFSHGEHDVRKPIVLKQGMPHKLVEPSLHLLQEQQTLVAALTGLSLAELNGFSMSGHNNSMSFGGGAVTPGGTGQPSSNSGSTSLVPSSSSSQLGMVGSVGGGNVGVGSGSVGGVGSGVGPFSQMSHVLQSQQHQHASHLVTAAWDGPGQPQQQSLSQPGPSQSASQSLQSTQGQLLTGLHSTDSPPIHYDKFGGLSQRPSSSGGSTGLGSGLSLNVSQPITDLTYGTAPNSPSLQSINTDPSFLSSLDPAEFMCPPDELPNEREYYLYTYKTQPCKNQTLACTKGQCPNFHYENKRRRNPRLYRYSHEPCIVVKPPPNTGSTGTDSGPNPTGSNGWKKPSCCRLGDSCEFSHTLLESMYHPQVYKTVLCSHFDERDRSTWQRCPWKRACAHAHGRLELEYAESCVREMNINQTARSLNSTTGGINQTQSGSERWSTNTSGPTSSTTSPPVHGISQNFHSDQTKTSSESSESGEAPFPGGSLAGAGFTREFVPSPPLTAHTSGTSTPTTSVASASTANNSNLDSSLRSMILKQDAAQRILRMQQQQLQPNSGQMTTGSTNTGGPTLSMPVPQVGMERGVTAPLSVGNQSSLIDTLRGENIHLLDRLSRYEKELYLLKNKLEEKDSIIQQLNWNLTMEKEEKTRMKNQLEQFRQEVTARLLQQHQTQSVAQGQQQQQPSASQLQLNVQSQGQPFHNPSGSQSIASTPLAGLSPHGSTGPDAPTDPFPSQSAPIVALSADQPQETVTNFPSTD